MRGPVTAGDIVAFVVACVLAALFLRMVLP